MNSSHWITTKTDTMTEQTKTEGVRGTTVCDEFITLNRFNKTDTMTEQTKTEDEGEDKD